MFLLVQLQYTRLATYYTFKLEDINVWTEGLGNKILLINFIKLEPVNSSIM